MKKLMFLFFSIFLILTVSSASADDTASGTTSVATPTPSEITTNTKAKINGLETSSGYLDVAFSWAIKDYSSACSDIKGSISNVNIVTSTGAQKCAKQIATKIVVANEAAVSRYITFNTNELRKVLNDSYKIRVAKRNNIPKVDRLIIYSGAILTALNAFNEAKYDYLNYVPTLSETGAIISTDPGIASLTWAIDEVKNAVNNNNNDVTKKAITSTGSSYLYDILEIEKVEVVKARKFKNELDKMRDNVTYNAKKALNLELWKLRFSNSSFIWDFRVSLRKTIINKTAYDSAKSEEKLIITFDKDTVLTNKDKRGEALKNFIIWKVFKSSNGILTITSIDLVDGNNAVFTRNTKNGLFEPQK